MAATSSSSSMARAGRAAESYSGHRHRLPPATRWYSEARSLPVRASVKRSRISARPARARRRGFAAIGEQPLDRRGQRRRIRRRDEQAGLLVAHRLGHAADRRRHHRPFHQQGLDGAAEALGERALDRDVERGQHTLDVGPMARERTPCRRTRRRGSSRSATAGSDRRARSSRRRPGRSAPRAAAGRRFAPRRETCRGPSGRRRAWRAAPVVRASADRSGRPARPAACRRRHPARGGTPRRPPPPD